MLNYLFGITGFIKVDFGTKNNLQQLRTEGFKQFI